MEQKLTVCHNCRQIGHKSTSCPNSHADAKLQNGSGISDFKMESSS